MRGEVIQYDDDLGLGFIAGSDGVRYAFEKTDLRRLAPLAKGASVEFQPVGERAKEIFVVRATTSVPAAGSPFGRAPTQPLAAMAPVTAGESLGLWGYFTRGLTANYANFRGRARRKEYWGFHLFWFIAVMLLAGGGVAIDGSLGNLDAETPIATFALPVLFGLATLLPGVAVTVRRIHDLGLSGWFYLLFFVPSIGGLIILVFALIPSQKYDNKWGPVPAGVPVPDPVVSQPAT